MDVETRNLKMKGSKEKRSSGGHTESEITLANRRLWGGTRIGEGEISN
jgi:hypothetical protein